MNKTDAADILREFEEHRIFVESKLDKRWLWRDGTLLFPEGRCCFCGGAVRSNRLWVIEEAWLRGQLNVEADLAVWERPEHPHSGTDGGLCTGGNDVLTALFFGINPADAIRRGMDIKAWYAKMFGHVCAENELKAATGLFIAATPHRRERRPNCPCGCGCNPDAGRCGCGCAACICDSFTCVKCEETFRREDYNPHVSPTDEQYCHACYNLAWLNCRYCNETVRRENAEQRYCAVHTEPEDRVPPTTPPWLTATPRRTVAAATNARERRRRAREAARITEAAIDDPF